MKTMICSMMVALFVSTLVPAFAYAKPIQTRPGSYEVPCVEKGDVNRCYELAYRFMHDTDAKTKKDSHRWARYYFGKACEIKTGKACSTTEMKLAARDFTQSNRAVASKTPATPTAPMQAQAQTPTVPKLNATSSASTAPSIPKIAPPTTFGNKR